MSAIEQRYVLLDRDGVINRRMPGGYVTSWDQFEFLPRAVEALRLLAARDLDTMIQRFLLEVALSGGNIGQVYYGRHDVEDQCGCRKPRALDPVDCRMILIRRTSFLEAPSLREGSHLVARNQYETAELILTAQLTKADEAVMEVVRA
jgi:hypothetical protein